MLVSFFQFLSLKELINEPPSSSTKILLELNISRAPANLYAPFFELGKKGLGLHRHLRGHSSTLLDLPARQHLRGDGLRSAGTDVQPDAPLGHAPSVAINGPGLSSVIFLTFSLQSMVGTPPSTCCQKFPHSALHPRTESERQSAFFRRSSGRTPYKGDMPAMPASLDAPRTRNSAPVVSSTNPPQRNSICSRFIGYFLFVRLRFVNFDRS